jgi:hypothetical protein
MRFNRILLDHDVMVDNLEMIMNWGKIMTCPMPTWMAKRMKLHGGILDCGDDDDGGNHGRMIT